MNLKIGEKKRDKVNKKNEGMQNNPFPNVLFLVRLLLFMMIVY